MRQNSHILQPTHTKCLIQWHLVYSELHNELFFALGVLRDQDGTKVERRLKSRLPTLTCRHFSKAYSPSEHLTKIPRFLFSLPPSWGTWKVSATSLPCWSPYQYQDQCQAWLIPGGKQLGWMAGAHTQRLMQCDPTTKGSLLSDSAELQNHWNMQSLSLVSWD